MRKQQSYRKYCNRSCHFDHGAYQKVNCSGQNCSRDVKQNSLPLCSAEVRRHEALGNAIRAASVDRGLAGALPSLCEVTLLSSKQRGKPLITVSMQQHPELLRNQLRRFSQNTQG